MATRSAGPGHPKSDPNSRRDGERNRPVALSKRQFVVGCDFARGKVATYHSLNVQAIAQSHAAHLRWPTVLSTDFRHGRLLPLHGRSSIGAQIHL
jgi:hypothetical protein